MYSATQPKKQNSKNIRNGVKIEDNQDRPDIVENAKRNAGFNMRKANTMDENKYNLK